MTRELITALRIIDLLLAAGPGAIELAASFKSLFVDGRVPTDEEFAALDARLVAAHDALQATGS